MEVATVTKTNNHNHSNFHHPEQQRMPSHHSHNGLSVGLISNGTGSANDAGGARSPFQREVREWQHIDPDTGALLTGRLEADRWINGPMNSYGKISDSQNISQPNGTQHTQRKQLEVLQARTATGAMQVIRAQTVQKTSSRWSSSTSTTTTSASTSASSSAVASPTIMRSLTANGSKTKHNHLNKPHFRSNHLIPPFLPQVSTLDNCRVSNSHSSSSRSSSDAEIDANDVDNDDVTGNVVKGNNNSTDRLSFLNNGHKNINGSNFSLLLDTAPSLKLSNLMKSNSSLSSDNSSSNNSTATSTKNNTHHIKSAAGKISLHSIVGGGENMRRTTATSTSTSTTTTLPSSSSSSLSTTTILSPLLTKTTSAMNWQQSQQQRSSRLFDQPTLYGKDSQRQSLTKSRVGVNDVEAGAVNDYDAGDDGVSITPTQLKSRQQQQDLESFRHYNEHQSTSTSTSTSTPTSIALPSANVVNRGNDDDEVLSLTEGHHRRQKDQSYDASTQIQRTRSISTDDLSTEWDEHEDNDNQESGEWRRVSKLRRSFQSSSNSKAENSTYPRKPIDLPSNSISVARIRAELENGRRLNTAMRNNHVDLAALDTILNGTGESSKSMPEQRNSFLTAESLKEIRAGLKKLSDESLYRDDYVPAMQNAAPDEQIEIQDVKKPPERIRTCQLMAEKSTEIAPTKSAFQVFTRTIPNLSSPTSYITQHSLPTGGLPKHTTHSLESRQKSKDSTSSIDWHLRRKSYGFEKMTPQDDKSVFRMDASTDSGLGRSGEQLGNWSPTESNNPSSLTTVIHFGETSKAVANTAKPIVKRRYHQPKTSETNESGLKRHSIAVDESQYVRDNARKTSQIHLKGYYDRSIDTSMNSLQPTRLLDSTETPINTTSSSNVLFQRNTSQQKRVEFCKTEVHFAAESGRVNIVETDGKPPPTNNFRRRRRTTSGPLQTLLTSSSTAASDSTNIPRSITLFGEQNETKVIASSTVAYKASLAESLSDKDPATTNVTFSTPKVLGNTFTHLTSSRSSYTSTSGVDTTDGETDEISAIRGILKNKPIKPKPYHLGENIENADALWGVQLKPIGGTVKHDFTKSSSPPSMASASVAERVRIVEQRQDNASISQTNGYSTKINLSLSDDPKVWSDTTELPKSNVMSIELHSPQTSLEGKDATQSIETMPPVAKQRTVMSAKHTELPQLHTTTTLKQTTDDPTNKEKNRDFLKIVKETRGARKLREHELSYFGVQAPKDNEKDVKSTYTGTQLRSLKRNLPQRKTNDDDSKPNRHAELISETTKQQKATNWQLLNDKPDLLKHNPITVEPHPITNATAIVPMERKSLKKPLTHDDENNEHIYENIATEIKTEFKVQSPTRMLAKTHDEYSSYNRKTDHKRDAMILNEMTENADQTLKAISDGAAIKDQRRRSLHRRSSKPLETINEKTITENINDKCIAVQITRGTLASDAKRSYRHKSPSPTKLSSRFRSSSTSSNEGCSCARSRSLSSECEYENIKLRPKRISTSATRSKTSKLSNRSSLQDSEHTTTGHCCSSGDDEMITRRERLRNSSSKAKLVLNSDTQKQSSKESMRQRDKMQFSPIGKSQRRGDDHKKRTSSSTAHSSRRERAECNDEVKTHHSRDNHGKQHHSTESSSSRRHKDNTSSSSTKGKLVERQERDRTHSSSTRCIDHSYHGNTQQQGSSSHKESERAEKSERDIGREKSSRSKAQSSRTNHHKNERISSTSHDKHRSATPTKLREHKKSTTTSKQQHTNIDTKYCDPVMSTTHGKNSPIISEQHYHQNAHHQNGTHENHHVHSMTKATIAAKQRESRSGKDRK